MYLMDVLPSQSLLGNNCLVLLLRIFCLFPSNCVSQYCSPILSTVSGWKSTWKPWKASLSCRRNSCQPATITSIIRDPIFLYNILLGTCRLEYPEETSRKALDKWRWCEWLGCKYKNSFAHTLTWHMGAFGLYLWPALPIIDFLLVVNPQTSQFRQHIYDFEGFQVVNVNVWHPQVMNKLQINWNITRHIYH